MQTGRMQSIPGGRVLIQPDIPVGPARGGEALAGMCRVLAGIEAQCGSRLSRPHRPGCRRRRWLLR